jgi:RNA polymerase sigma factor (sigma-70 family)
MDGVGSAVVGLRGGKPDAAAHEGAEMAPGGHPVTSVVSGRRSPGFLPGEAVGITTGVDVSAAEAPADRVTARDDTARPAANANIGEDPGESPSPPRTTSPAARRARAADPAAGQPREAGYRRDRPERFHPAEHGSIPEQGSVVSRAPIGKQLARAGHLARDANMIRATLTTGLTGTTIGSSSRPESLPRCKAEVTHSMSTELTDLVRSGEIVHYGQLFESHLARASQLARRYAGDLSNADDLVSCAFEKILMALVRGAGPSDDSFAAYLYTVIRNEVASRAHEEQRERLLIEHLQSAPPVEDYWDHLVSRSRDSLFVAMALKVFSQLHPRHRTVLHMTTVNHEPKSAVCDALKTTPNGADALAYRARKELRRRFCEERHNVTYRATRENHGLRQPFQLATADGD